jgi:hypothetical protein
MKAGAGRAAFRGAWTVVLGAVLCACASIAREARPVQYLDRSTAATFMVAARPMIFAHLRPQTAARVRDYATVAAASLERSGRTDRIDYVLLIYFWSTVDPRYENSAGKAVPDVVLVADDRRIPLRPLLDSGQALPPIGRPPVRHCLGMIYRTDLATLRFLALAHYVSLQRGTGRYTERFTLWDDERGALAGLVRAAE